MLGPEITKFEIHMAMEILAVACPFIQLCQLSGHHKGLLNPASVLDYSLTGYSKFVRTA